jgi:uncharacterized protein (TIGR02270 family)
VSTGVPVIQTIIDQHAEEAAFLWLLRDADVGAPHYTLKDLADLDERVEAHIDGLRVAGEAGWTTCEAALQLDEPGEVFAAGVLAFEAGDGERIARVVQQGSGSRENFRALISAAGWLEVQRAVEISGALLNANDPAYRRLGLGASRAHRVPPGPWLDAALNDDDAAIRVAALRAVGELKHGDALPALRRHAASDDHPTRFWAVWSATLLGDRAAAKGLADFVNFDTPFRFRALDLALRVADGTEAQNWLRGLWQQDGTRRLVLEGAGVAGDPAYIPHLLRQMSVPEHARVAGEAFSMITGVDLAYEDLEADWPDGFEAGPTENADDEDVAMDPDEDLPWPDPALVEQWWADNQSRFSPGTRYLCGGPVTAEHCRVVLETGYQRQRRAAAMELALMRQDVPLFETRAPGVRQQRVLCR